MKVVESSSPVKKKRRSRCFRNGIFALVRLKGLEPPVSRFVAVHSIQLSYRRMSFRQLCYVIIFLQ